MCKTDLDLFNEYCRKSVAGKETQNISITPTHDELLNTFGTGKYHLFAVHKFRNI